jgi:hypothetical protein
MPGKNGQIDKTVTSQVGAYGGLPPRCVLGLIRHPIRIRRAFPVTGLLRVPVPWSPVERRFQPWSVAGLPLRGLRSCRPSSKAVHVQERLGLPQCFDASLPACHGLRTPADLPLLAVPEGSWSLRERYNPRPPPSPWRSGPSTAGGAVPPAASRRRCRRFAHRVHRECPHDSAMDARLDTGGWLTLPRQGLSPCQRRQAYLGARTHGV